MFGWGKKNKKDATGITGKSPAIRQSICTGEKTAGFLDNATGRFEEIALIRGERDLLSFMAEYGIKSKSEIKTFY